MKVPKPRALVGGAYSKRLGSLSGAASEPRVAAIIVVVVIVLPMFALSQVLEIPEQKGQKLFVYLVESDIPLGDEVPHLPGAKWALGEQALVVFVPRDVGRGFVLFTNETVDIPAYDRKYFLLALPAGAKPAKARGNATLKTPDGEFPVVFRKPDGGLIEVVAGSVDEAFKILRELGFQPEFRGRARLERGGGSRTDGASAAAAAPAPSTGASLYVYGGVYFRPVRVSSSYTEYVVPVHGESGASACRNVPDAAYIGYDAASLSLGVLIKGGSVDGVLTADVYRINADGTCTLLQSSSYTLADRARLWISGVNLDSSRGSELAVRVRVYINTYSGAPAVGINGTVQYLRYYYRNYTLAEMLYATATDYYGRPSGYSVGSYIDRILIGPYAAFDGLVEGTFTGGVALQLTTDAVGGTCPGLMWELWLNGMWYVAGSTAYGSYNSGTGGCFYEIDTGTYSLGAYPYSFAKSFGGALSWLVKIKFDNGATPYVRAVFVRTAEVFRAWRWVEQWKDFPDAMDKIWRNPYAASVLEIYGAPSDPQAGPYVYHGLVLLRVNDIYDTYQRIMLQVEGRSVSGGYVDYIKGFEVYMRLSIPTKTSSGSASLYKANYIKGTSIADVTKPWLIDAAQRVLDAINFILIFVPSKLASLLAFLAGQALQTASGSYNLDIIDSNNVRVWWTAPWTGSESDSLLFAISLPTAAADPYASMPIEVKITKACLEQYCISPDRGLKGYIQPTNPFIYSALRHAEVKTWMFRGLTSAGMKYVLNDS